MLARVRCRSDKSKRRWPALVAGLCLVAAAVAGVGCKPKTPVAGMAEHERSLAVRVELRDDEQTLTDERIDAAMQAVLAAVGSAVGARVRA